MAYDVVIEEAPGYLRAEVSGSRTPGSEAKDSKRVWTQVAEACRARGLTRVLAVWKVPGRLPTMQAYDIGSSADELDSDRRFKVADVELCEETRADSLFAETVAVNRGHNIKIFSNEEEAKHWLLES